MRTGPLLVLTLLTHPFVTIGCGDAPPDAPPPARAPVPGADVARAAPPPDASRRDPRLREDCGGWEPPADLLAAAAELGDPERRDALSKALDDGPLAHKIDVLRAGLRLADDAAARACAARLLWEWIDGWECSRCVALLGGSVFLDDSEGGFEDLRSYLGSSEVAAFVASLPPPPWEYGTGSGISQLHRVLREEHIPLWCRLARDPDPDIARVARSDLENTVLEWTTAHRNHVAALWLGLPAGAADGSAPPGPGLPPLLAQLLSAGLASFPLEKDGAPAERAAKWFRTWCLESMPGPQDENLLAAVAESRTDLTGQCAVILLGRIRGTRSDEVLRKLAATDANPAAWRSLAQRGDPGALDRVEAGKYLEDLATLMEAAPERARALIEARLFEDDDEAAYLLLSTFVEFLTPGDDAWSDADGHDFRRTSLAGVVARAATAPMSAARRAAIGSIVPGCWTRAVADAVCRDLTAPGLATFSADEYPSCSAFSLLEVGALTDFRKALWTILDDNASGDEPRDTARDILRELGDPSRGADLLALGAPEDLTVLARSPCAEVRRHLERVARGEAVGSESSALAALSMLDGLPEDAASAYSWSGDGAIPAAARDAVLAGRPADGIALLLAAAPDESHGSVGALDDPRVRAYLERLRDRRELELHWYAVGQLAVLGDPAARAEFWGAMTEGRYRIMDEAEEFERTLGWDLAATMPFWISELRSNCCRVVTGASGDLVEAVLGLQSWGNTQRTAYARAKELWDAAGGRFVRSRLAGHWVPEPR